jgi:hypothetical protein
MKIRQRRSDTGVSQPTQVTRSTQVRRQAVQRAERSNRVERRESRRDGVRVKQRSRSDSED